MIIQVKSRITFQAGDIAVYSQYHRCVDRYDADLFDPTEEVMVAAVAKTRHGRMGRFVVLEGVTALPEHWKHRQGKP